MNNKELAHDLRNLEYRQANSQCGCFCCDGCDHYRENCGEGCIILNQAADALERAADYEKILADFSKVVNDEFQAMAEQKKSGWTSVKDEQPKVWKNSDGLVNYFVFTKEFGVDIGNYLAPAHTWLCFGFPADVTHWMPLPEAPEENQNG